MPELLGKNNRRLDFIRDLQSASGRNNHRAFIFEGPTMLEEAHRSAYPIREIYATESAYKKTPLLREMHGNGTVVYFLDGSTFAKLSDLNTVTGILGIAEMRLAGLDAILGAPPHPVTGRTVALMLADINDPGNAGTLMRSAEGFGASGAVFGNLAVDPFHPKVVRGAMGAHFRLPLAIVAEPSDLRASAKAVGSTVAGLEKQGEPLTAAQLGSRCAIVVGHERHGLGRWDEACNTYVGIPMPGNAESLNAAMAGSIALYELTRR